MRRDDRARRRRRRRGVTPLKAVDVNVLAKIDSGGTAGLAAATLTVADPPATGRPRSSAAGSVIAPRPGSPVPELTPLRRVHDGPS